MNFRPSRLYVLSSISKTLHNFSTGFFSRVQRNTRAKKTVLGFCAKMAHSQIRRVAA